MTNVTKPSPLRAAHIAPGAPLHGPLKGALATLVLLLLALLFWQLLDQLQQNQKDQQQYTINYSADLAEQISLNMALSAQIALNLLPIVEPPRNEEQHQALMRSLQRSLPELRSVALLAPSGAILSDSADNSQDSAWLEELVKRSHAQSYYLSNNGDGSIIYLLLHQPSGGAKMYWVLRLAPNYLANLTRQDGQGSRPMWAIENQVNHRVVSRDSGMPSQWSAGLTPEELNKTVLVTPLSKSDWQLRGLFDRAAVLEQLLPAFIGKCLLGLAFSLIPVLVLLNMRRRQRQVNEGRRRYQDIFDGTGVALCVLDLSGLRGFFDKAQLHTREQLQEWLHNSPEQRQQLLKELRITEVNQVAVRLLNVASCEQAWERLIDGCPLNTSAIGYAVLEAVLTQHKQLELEIQLSDIEGNDQYLWLVMRLPEEQHDYKAVILSISDITSRKLVELSLVEREAFWSDVVRTVPDHLYVQDVISQRMIFSNHHLGHTLGYNKHELQQMGEYFWEILLHPEDAESYHDLRQQQRAAGYLAQLQCQLRFRHRNNQWRRFEIREQALARDKTDQVTRIIGVAKDITDQIEASESLRDSEQRYRMLAESISDVIFSTDSKLALNYVSPSVNAVLGYEVDWIFKNGWQSTIANPQQLTGIYTLVERVSRALDQPEALALLRDDVQTQLFLFDCLRADGRKVPIELRLVLVWDEHGAFEGILGVGRDISQQRRAEKDLRMAATVFEHSTSAILITDPAGYIVQANEAFSRVSGYAVADVLDQLPNMLTVDEQQEAHLRYVLKQLHQHSTWEGEVWLKRRSGEHYPAWVGITAVLDDEGDLASYVCFFSDISERKASEQRIHRLAYYDALTHLPNRTLFQDRLHTALQSAERQKSWVVLMFLDLDRFKPINDSLGHAAGDRMLKEMATRLLGCVAEDDTVARMGGDEFTLLLQPRVSREMALNRAIHVAEQILASLVKPFVLEGREFFCHRQYRYRPEPSGRQRTEPVDEKRRHGDVPRQGTRQEQLPVLPGRHERQRPGAPGTGKRPAPCPGPERIRALLPAAVQWRWQTFDWRRSPAALASPTPWPGATGGFHSGPGRVGPGGGRGRLGDRRGVPPTQDLAPEQGASAQGLGEYFGAAVLRRAVGHADRHHPQGNRPAAGVPGAGVDRKHPDARGQRGPADPCQPEKPRPEHRCGRLRHRLLIAQLPQAIPHRRAEDRPHFRRRPAVRRTGCADRPGNHRHGPQPEPGGDRRRRGNP